MPSNLGDLPALAAQWHQTLNGDLAPTEVKPYSNKTVWWQCDQGHAFEAKIANRVALGRGCPYCAGKRAGYGNDLASRAPEIAAEWHSTRNGDLTPAQVVPGSGSKVWWVCPSEHEYEAVICKRVGEHTGCPYCVGRRVGYGNDLATLRADVAAEWHPTRNGTLTPAEVVPGSGKIAWWLCPTGHEYDAPVYKRTSGDNGCPYCSGRRAGQGTELAVLRPDLAAQWHPTRNAGLSAAQVTQGSSRRVWWRCDLGHDFDATVNNRVGNDQGCPYCSGHRVGYGNDLATLHPDLAAEWHKTKNDAMTPDQVRPKSHRMAWWCCTLCDFEWQAAISSRANGRGCPPCATRRGSALRRQPASGTSLADERPDVAAQWHPQLNGDRTPDQVNKGSSDSAWWLCQNGHHWSAVISIRSRENGASGCPYCAGQRATAENNLALLNTALASQWHPKRNGALTPQQVMPNSHRAVWWRCAKGHEWRAQVSSRTVGRNCPYCANVKVGYGNDLATRFPRIAAEWHPGRNGQLTPEQVVAGTDRKVWWLCRRGHAWRTTIDSRTSRGSGCPDCCLVATSKLEIRIFAELAHVLVPHVAVVAHNPRISAPPGRKMTVDMLFGDIVIEYDGAYWHGGSDLRDATKTARLIGAGYQVLRIREHPLDTLTDHDVPVPANQAPHVSAATVLGALMQCGWLPEQAGGSIRSYITASTTVAQRTADHMIASRLFHEPNLPEVAL